MWELVGLILAAHSAAELAKNIAVQGDVIETFSDIAIVSACVSVLRVVRPAARLDQTY